MKLKRSTIRHIAVALPAFTLLGLTACSSDDAEPAPKKETKGIALTIPLSSTRSGDDVTPDMKNMVIATYDEGGHLIETIWKDNQFSKSKSPASEFDKVYEVSKYGTVMSVVLPMETYEEYTSREIGEHYGIQFAAFYLPEPTSFMTGETGETFEVPDDLSKLNTAIEEAYTLNFPSVSEGVWVADADGSNIPMAGVLDITSAVENYDPALWSENNPMFLNNDPLVLIRSMAKITIKNGNDEPGKFLTGAKFKTSQTGSLLPDFDKVVVEGSDTKVNEVTLPELVKEYWQEDNKAADQYVFYTFERDLSGAHDRNLISVSWAGHGEKILEFKPEKLADQSKAEWQGILRNHSYQFTIIKPADQDVQVEVKVEKWDTYDYEEKI
ncbi:MAG: hypothetical protein K2M63_04030 [Muribaculaceae bacterium]|nr:hypothetical protein [Muribaculaceae bacterium]